MLQLFFFFQKNKFYPPAEDINEKFQGRGGGRVRVGKPKIEEKTLISSGANSKK